MPKITKVSPTIGALVKVDNTYLRIHHKCPNGILLGYLTDSEGISIFRSRSRIYVCVQPDQVSQYLSQVFVHKFFGAIEDFRRTRQGKFLCGGIPLSLELLAISGWVPTADPGVRWPSPMQKKKLLPQGKQNAEKESFRSSSIRPDAPRSQQNA